MRTLDSFKLALTICACSDVKAVFDAIDRDRSGAVEHKEFRMAMQRLGLGLTEKQMTMLIKKLDPTSAGVISSKRFHSWLGETPRGQMSQTTEDEATTVDFGGRVCRGVTALTAKGGVDKDGGVVLSHRARRFEALVSEKMEKEKCSSPTIPESSRKLAAAARSSKPKIWERQPQSRADPTWIENMSPLRRCEW
jgi:hypothetical protein